VNFGRGDGTEGTESNSDIVSSGLLAEGERLRGSTFVSIGFLSEGPSMSADRVGLAMSTGEGGRVVREDMDVRELPRE